ncbi:MAG: DUF3274 domain-containing protein [Massilia sp.]
MGIYERVPYTVGKDSSVLQSGRLADKKVNVRPNLPGNVIVIHGVNDVGTGFNAVESGLCEGLRARIGWHYVPGEYRMPEAKDKNELQEDPDAVFFKRQIHDNTASPVIPFYWGFRETERQAGSLRGQRIDRYGNRLDKDLSKGGGPFANATSSLPDMWAKGKSKAHGLLDYAQKDATHPVLDNPGHLYMVLAAKRLAALISMIRDYDENEAVTLVAHSQGCMLSLLAQAFLLEDGIRPADTLILNNPPYSLVDEIPMTTNWVEGTSGADEQMKEYGALNGRQTMHARLQTLVNIVHGVVGKKHATPAFTALDDQRAHHGMVSGLWRASADRDNRGKVYLYFCPEDMTVALNNVQGIGWQGVPDFQHGKRVIETPEVKRDPETRQQYKTGRTTPLLSDIVRQPMNELTAHNASGAGFYQRVFSAKKRPDPNSGKPVLIGQAAPHDFVLRAKGEDDQAHTDTSDSFTSKHGIRAHFAEPASAKAAAASHEAARANLRRINGESLPVPVEASLCEGAYADAKGRAGASEDVDQIDAAIAITSDYGLASPGVWQLCPDPTGRPCALKESGVARSPAQSVYPGFVTAAGEKVKDLQIFLNKGRNEAEAFTVLEVFDCMGISGPRRYTGQVLVRRSESGDEARLRWQQASGARSFHGAIFGGAANHRQVTAYDIAIGGGKAASDPLFYQYLCAVADWRLQQGPKARPSIMRWDIFLTRFKIYWKTEPQWRKDLIKASANYYSTGELPACVPSLEGLPSTVVCETVDRTIFSRSGKPAEVGGGLSTLKKGGI